MGALIKKIISSLITLLVLFFSVPVLASPEIDRVYQLETLAWLKASDNVDGIFTDYLDEQYTKYFKKQSRFAIKKLNGLDSLLGNSSVPYHDLVQSRDLTKKIAQKFKVESLIRTRIYKESETYRFVMEWVFAPKGDVLSTVEFRYVDPQKEQGLENSDLPAAIDDALDQLIAKLPFLGQVTGMEGEIITVSLGRNQRIHSGDTFSIATLDSVRRHPILNTIEEWRWETTGKAQVQQVEESLCFAKIIEVEPKMAIAKYQKIREVIPAPKEKRAERGPREEAELPRIGWLAGNLGVGNYSREVGLGTSGGRGGGGFAGTLEVDSQLWLNSRWLAQASIMQGFTKYNAEDLSTGAVLSRSYSGTATQFRIAGGYSIFPARTVFDSIAWVTAGLRFTSFSLPTQSTDFTASSNVSSFFVGFGGEVPIEGGISAQLGIDLGLLKSGSSENLLRANGSPMGDSTSASDLMFSAGLSYHYENQIFFRLLFKINSQSIDFLNGETLSQKLFTVAPSVMYYF